MDGPPSDEICSICLGSFDLPCRSNCCHWFCGCCILKWWNCGPGLNPCQCPICQGFITRLNAVVQGHQRAESCQVLKIIHKYNRLFGTEPSSLLQKISDRVFLIKRLLRKWMHLQRLLLLVSWVEIRFAMMLIATYVVSPVDFLPREDYGFVGLLDDLLIVLVFFMLIAIMYCLIFLSHGRP